MTRKRAQSAETPRFDGTAPQGRSLLQHLWDELDIAFARLQTKGIKHKHRQQGVCLGLAQSIAIIENGYQPDVANVKDRAYHRWERTHGNRQRGARLSA